MYKIFCNFLVQATGLINKNEATETTLRSQVTYVEILKAESCRRALDDIKTFKIWYVRLYCALLDCIYLP